MLQLENAVVGDVHLLEPGDERLRLRAIPITEDFAFSQIGKALVACDNGILLGSDGDLTKLVARKTLGRQCVSDDIFEITIGFLSVSVLDYFQGARYFTDFFAALSISSGVSSGVTVVETRPVALITMLVAAAETASGMSMMANTSTLPNA